MDQSEFAQLKEAQYAAATALAAALCYGTAPEYLEQLQANFRRSDEALCKHLGLDYATHSRPFAAAA